MRKRLLTSIATLLLAVGVVTSVDASSLQPSLNTISITEGQGETGTLTYTNTSERLQRIEPLIAAYDTKDGKFLPKSDVFITTQFTGGDVAPGESLFIDYEIEVPLGTTGGTYFNVLAAIEKNADPDADGEVGLEIGGGALFSINVFGTDKSTVISGEGLGGELEVIQEGIYLIRPAIVRYTFANPTRYVLRPVGELRAREKDGTLIDVLTINIDDEPLYKNSSLVEEIEYPVPFWGKTSVIVTLAESLSGNEGTNSIDVPNYSVYIWTIIIGFTMSGILWLHARIRKWSKERKGS